MTPAIELVPLICCRCQTPVPAETDEIAWVCANCGQGLLLSETKGTQPLVVNYAAGLMADKKGRPFWVATGQVNLQRRLYGAGDQSASAQAFWQSPHRFMVPAFALPLQTLVDVGSNLLLQSPILNPGTTAPFLPVTLATGDIQPMAEFIVMGIEAARKDNLKEMTFTLNLSSPELWIVP